VVLQSCKKTSFSLEKNAYIAGNYIFTIQQVMKKTVPDGEK